MQAKANAAVRSTRIHRLIELDSLVSEHLTGAEPEVHWEDSHGFFSFATREEGLEAISDSYHQLFLPQVDWTRTLLVEVKRFPAYSQDISAAWQVVEKLALQKRTLTLSRENGGWLAAFEGSPRAFSRSASVAICVAALRAKGIELEIDPDLISSGDVCNAVEQGS
jgi:hypothetical protein